MLSRRRALTFFAAAIFSSFTLFSNAYAQTAPQVKLETSSGTIVIEVDTKNAPITAENFLRYANEGFYENTIFHRVIDGFMIQGGGFTAAMEQKQTHAPIKLEIAPELKNLRGTVAMARTSNPHSATSQFFINVADSPNLDGPRPDGWGYAVFGRVVEGMDVVDKIRVVSTGYNKGHRDVPLNPIIINKVSVTQP